jgi:energy-coupling factor transport system substrate-specific component
MNEVANGNAVRITPAGRWTLKNIVTLTVFTVIIFIVMMLATIAANIILTPIGSYYAGPGIAAMLAGPFYMVMATRIGKRGVLFFVHLITALFFLIIGQIYTFGVYAVMGVIGELCMLGKDAYKSFWRNCVGFFIYFLALSGSAIFPMLLFRESYIAWYSAYSDPAAVELLTNVYFGPQAIAATILLTAAGAVLGCLIGRALVNRHVKKAKI